MTTPGEHPAAFGSPPDEGGNDPRRWRALTVSLAAGFMALLDVSIVNVALPSMQRGLHASPAGIQWVVSGYALAFGLTLVAGGRLGDLLGRRRMFQIALSAFVLTSAAAGAAPDEALLIVARLAQGMAAGLLIPQNSGMVQELFRGAERGRAFGRLGAVIGVSTAAGPVLGGLILALAGGADGWRWVFFVNVPIGVVTLYLSARLWPPGRPGGARGLASHIDFVGIGLLGSSVFAVLFPVIQAQGGGSPLVWLLLVVAAAGGVAFVRWELHTTARGRSPLLDMRLFTQTSGFPSGMTLSSIYFCGFTGVWLVLALFLQNGLGYSALESGLAITSFALGSAVSSAVTGRLVARWGRRVTVTGLLLVIAGLAGTAILIPLVGPARTGLVVALPLLVAGIGGGAVISPNTTMTLSRVPTAMAGAAGGALQTGQRIGSALGTAALATVYRVAVTGTHGHYAVAAAVAIGSSVVIVAGALVVAIRELRIGRPLVDQATTTASTRGA